MSCTDLWERSSESVFPSSSLWGFYFSSLSCAQLAIIIIVILSVLQHSLLQSTHKHWTRFSLVSYRYKLSEILALLWWMANFPLTSVGLRFHSLLVKEFGQSKPSERGECDSWKETKPLFLSGEHIYSQNGGQAHPDCRGKTEGRKPNLFISQCASFFSFFSLKLSIRLTLCFYCVLKFISLSHLYK